MTYDDWKTRTPEDEADRLYRYRPAVCQVCGDRYEPNGRDEICDDCLDRFGEAPSYGEHL